MDVADFFEFGLELVKKRVKKLNSKIKVIPISAKTGEGMEEWFDWLRTVVKEWNQ